MQTARDPASIIYDVNEALCAIRHSADGVSPANPAAALARLAELEQFREYGASTCLRGHPHRPPLRMLSVGEIPGASRAVADLQHVERRGMIAPMRDLAVILDEIEKALRVLCDAVDGLTPEDPLAAMRSVGELADELEQLGDFVGDPADTPTR
jgi:hypothetical protein